MANEITLNFTNFNKLPSNTIEIPALTKDNTTSLEFRGLAMKGYLTPLNEAMLHLLEHFANPTAPDRAIEGQLWYDKVNEELNVAYESAPSIIAWKTITSIYVASTAPPATLEGKLWFDTTIAQLKVFNGATYESALDDYLLVTGGTLTGNLTTAGLTANGTVGVDSITGFSAGSLVVDDLLEVGEIYSQTYPDNKFRFNGDDVEITSEDNISIVAGNVTSTDADLGFSISNNSPGIDITSRLVSYKGSTNILSFFVPFEMNNLQIDNVRTPAINSLLNDLVPNSAVTDLGTDILTGLVLTIGDTMTGPLESIYHNEVEPDLIDTSRFLQLPSVTIDSGIIASNLQLTNAQGGIFQLANRPLNVRLNVGGLNIMRFQKDDGRMSVINHPLTNVANPVDDYDLLNKQTVDDRMDEIRNSIPAPETQPVMWARFGQDASFSANSTHNVGTVTKLGTGNYRIDLVDDIVVPGEEQPHVVASFAAGRGDDVASDDDLSTNQDGVIHREIFGFFNRGSNSVSVRVRAFRRIRNVDTGLIAQYQIIDADPAFESGNYRDLNVVMYNLYGTV